MQDIFTDRLREFTVSAVAATFHILLIVGLAAVAVLALRVAARYLYRLLAEQGSGLPEEREQYARTVSGVLKGTGLVIIIAVAITMILAEIGVDITPILAGAGIVGLAVGFGAQTLVKDVISGLFILVERQFSVGDFIEVKGLSGAVEKMTLRATFLRDSEGTRHVIPNGEIRILSNRSEGWGQAVLDVSIGYTDSIERATQVLESIGEELQADPEFGKFLLERPKVLGVQALSGSSVVLRMTAKTRPGQQVTVTRELRRRVKERFDAEGIHLA